MLLWEWGFLERGSYWTDGFAPDSEPLNLGRKSFELVTARPRQAVFVAVNVQQLVKLKGSGGTRRFEVLVRDAQCDDWEALRRMYLGLTDRTRYLYFCAGVPANDKNGICLFGLDIGRANDAAPFFDFSRQLDG